MMKKSEIPLNLWLGVYITIVTVLKLYINVPLNWPYLTQELTYVNHELQH